MQAQAATLGRMSATLPAPPIHLRLSAYSQPVRDAIAPGWQVLDNLNNERPDWFEYWPIRRFLLGDELDEQAFYGFFSPKFSAKTGLGTRPRTPSWLRTRRVPMCCCSARNPTWARSSSTCSSRAKPSTPA